MPRISRSRLSRRGGSGLFLTEMARRIQGHEVVGAVADAYCKGEAEQALAEGGIEWAVE